VSNEKSIGPEERFDAALFHGGKLVFVDGFESCRRRPISVDLPSSTLHRRSEAKELGVQVLLEKSGEAVSGSAVHGGNHQKYPSRFFSSIEPSSSWSMARFSRSERRNETISSMILGTVSASERIAPVQGTHPRDPHPALHPLRFFSRQELRGMIDHHDRPIAKNHIAFARKIEAHDRDLLHLNVKPNVELGPVRERKNANTLTLVEAGIENVP